MITKLTSAMVAAGIVVAGLGVGFAGQRVFADDGSNAARVGSANQTVQTFQCPDRQPIGVLSSGDRVFITGMNKAKDPTWLEIRNPGDSTGRVWVSAAALRADGSTEKLPVVTCDHSVTGKHTASGPHRASTTIPGATTTTEPGATTTTRPGETTLPGQTTVPGQRPIPGRPAPTRPGNPGTLPGAPAPTVDKLIANPTAITENRPDTCSGKAYSSTITALVEDATSAQLHWNLPGKSSGTRSMSRSGATFTAQLGPFGPYGSDDDGTIDVWVTASGPGGTTTSESIGVTFKDCPFFG